MAAAVVLFIVFGSFIAMLLPLITAALSLGSGISVVGLLSHVIDIATFSNELALLIGLGVGVDYALFIVTRYKQALSRGATREAAVVEAIDTSGRAVLFAGVIVVHRHAWDVRAWRQLPVRRRDCGHRHGRVHGRRGLDAPAGAARDPWWPGPSPPRAARAEGGQVQPERGVTGVGTVGRCNEPAPGRLRRRRRARDDHHRDPVLVDAARISRCRHRPVEYHKFRKAYDLLAKGFGPGYNGPVGAGRADQ